MRFACYLNMAFNLIILEMSSDSIVKLKTLIRTYILWRSSLLLNVGKPNFSDLFYKYNSRYKRVGYSDTQSRCVAMVSSLIARRWVRPQTQ